MTEDFKGGSRELVHEIVQGSIVLSIYKKNNPKTGNVYYDYKSFREFYAGDNQKYRDPFCQQRDLRDHIVACARAMEWISDRHRERKANEDC